MKKFLVGIKIITILIYIKGEEKRDERGGERGEERREKKVRRGAEEERDKELVERISGKRK